jgi:type II secretory pathway component PulF
MMTGIWLTLIVLFVFIKIYVVPLAPISPLSGYLWDLITAGVQVLITGFYCLGALYVWFRLIKTYFWRKMKKSTQVENEKEKMTNK